MNRILIFVACMFYFAGCSSPRQNDPSAKVARFFVEAVDTRSMTVVLPTSGVKIAVNAQPVLTEGDIADVAVAQVDLGKCLMFQVATGVTRDLYRLTGSHQGRRLVLTVDGVAVGARRIDGPIADGVLFIFVEVPDESLPALVSDLKKGVAAVQRERARKG